MPASPLVRRPSRVTMRGGSGAVTEETIQKKQHHYLKLLKQSVGKAAKLEVRKVRRRIAEAEASGDDATKLRAQLERIQRIDAEALCRAVGPVGADPAGAPKPSSSSDLDAVEQRVVRHACVREVLAKWTEVVTALRKALRRRERLAAAIEARTKQKKSRIAGEPSSAKPAKKRKPNKAPAPKPAPKRLGQRARRLLAERKYGSAANHIVAGAGPIDQGGLGAADAKEYANEQRRAYLASSQAATPEAKKTSAPAAAKAQVAHPSWVAKQAAAQRQRGAGPQGKKIVFQ